ncbi:MAG: response regulator [Nitrospirota bacterium]|nr:response regulator [Nitrospirota bacterium]
MEVKTVTVLVVDDDRRMVKTIRDVLRLNGYATLEAFTGTEAVEMARTNRLDCILMDVRMPATDGISALQMIRAEVPYLPVLMMSAYTTEEQVAEIRKQGADAVLSKPFDLEMVLSYLALLKREKSILIVDDDPAFCKTLQGVLEARGCTVKTEPDTDMALARMEESYQLVVILDIKVGNTNGLEALKAIRAKYPTKPVLLVAGERKDMAGVIDQGLQIGAYTCLYKPLSVETLLRTINDIRKQKLRVALGEPFGCDRTAG